MKIEGTHLHLAIKKVTNFIKKENKYSSLKPIADSINISQPYLSILRGDSKRSTDSARHEYLLKICKKYNLSITINKNSILVKRGYNKENFSDLYIILLWNNKTSKIRFIKVYKYYFLGPNSVELEELKSKRPFFYSGLYNKTKLIFNDELKENYEFESFNMPGFNGSEHFNKVTDIKDFFIGKEISKNYLGSLFIGFEIKYLKFVEENLDYFRLFLTSKSLQESISSSIKTFGDLVNYIQFYNSQKRTITVKFPKSINLIFHQFLNYFVKFVEEAKGQKIRFDILNRTSYLEIEIWANKEKDINDISNYLKEYLNLLNQDIDNLSIEIEKNMSTNDFNFLILDLKQQIRNLKGSLDLAKLKNNNLENEIIYLKKIVDIIHNTQLKKLSHESPNKSDRKTKLLNLLSKNKLEECIDELLNIFKLSDNKEVLKEIIIHSSKYSENEKHRSYGILSNEDLEINRSKITSSLIDIVQKKL